MKKTKRRLKPRHIFCIVSVLTVLIVYFIFLCNYSRVYTFSFWLTGKTDLSTVEVTVSDESKVKVNKIYTGKFKGNIDALFIDIESISPGHVRLSASYTDIYQIYYDPHGEKDRVEYEYYPQTMEVDLHVTPFGMIYNETYDTFRGIWTVNLLGCVLTLIVIITLALSFREKQKNGDFTYSMVIIGGVVFFLTVTLLLSLYQIIIGWDLRDINTFKSQLYTLSQIGTSFMQATEIPLLLFCLALSISNIQLVRHEGFRPQNLLGVLLGFFVIAAMSVVHFVDLNLNWFDVSMYDVLTIINMAISFVVGYMESLLVSTIVCAVASTKYKIQHPLDYLIILGCAIRKDGTPTPILQGRIDRALSFDREQAEKWDRHAKFVPSGGQGSDEVISEAESMKRYLMEQGIPEERILKEDRSVNTYQNMAFSKKVIQKDAGRLSEKTIGFSTTNYHVFRGYTLAQRVGMKVRGLSAKTKLYFFPNAFLREFIGLLFEKKWIHLIALLIVIVFFTSLYLILTF